MSGQNPFWNLNKTLRSFIYAARGIFLVFRYENNTRVHLAAGLAAIILGIVLEISRLEWIAVIMQIGLVWTAEIVNTALEKLVDMISPEFNPKAGVIKDMAAGAVLVTSVMALLVGILIFGSRILAFFYP
jgi:diacylglycerol kinase